MPATDLTHNGGVRAASLRALCVSIHDVAPQTWSRCRHWLQAIHAVANIPVTLLAVPHYHRDQNYHTAQFDSLLERRLAQGDELALHGYVHLDEGGVPTNVWNRFVRNVYTQKEAEFYAIDANEARHRLRLGLEWFQRNRWPVTGFVAPAWLLGKESWKALREFPFRYTTTMRRFYMLPDQAVIDTPSLVYSARNAWLKQFSFARNAAVQYAYRHAPLLRIGLHPNDILHRDIIRNTQRLLEKFLENRMAMTKISFTNMWQQCAAAAGSPASNNDSFISVYCKSTQDSEPASATDQRRIHVL